MNDHTLLVGGTVTDGTGTAPMVADLLLEGDRIAAIGQNIEPPDGCEVREISGLMVAPGFVDLHSHADFSLLAFPTADSAIRQGITTVATGNCGGGVAPIGGEQDVASVAFAYDPDWGVAVDWRSFGEYTRRLDGAAINVAPLLAHGAVRNVVMGSDPRRASAEEVAAMRGVVAASLDEGAFGMSTGLEYRPGLWADEGELTELVREVGARGRLYATHMRGRSREHADATAEALRVARKSGARLQLSHFASRPSAPPEVSDEAHRLVVDAFGAGDPVGVDTFPEIWGPALLIDLFPSWVFDGDDLSVLGRLSDDESRAAIRRHFDETPSFLATVAGYGSIYIADAPNSPALHGMALTGIDPDRSPADVACDLLLEAGTQYRSVAIRHIYATEAELRRTLSLPFCSVESDGVVTTGEGDDCPLVWNASTYGYVPRVLGHYVRDTGFFTVEEAVRRMTSLPAQALGLPDRGTISVGNRADIVVLDMAKVNDLSRPDDPARHPKGIELVFVNGELVVESGMSTGSRPGRLLAP